MNPRIEGLRVRLKIICCCCRPLRCCRAPRQREGTLLMPLFWSPPLYAEKYVFCDVATSGMCRQRTWSSSSRRARKTGLLWQMLPLRCATTTILRCAYIVRLLCTLRGVATALVTSKKAMLSRSRTSNHWAILEVSSCYLKGFHKWSHLFQKFWKKANQT